MRKEIFLQDFVVKSIRVLHQQQALLTVYTSPGTAACQRV